REGQGDRAWRAEGVHAGHAGGSEDHRHGRRRTRAGTGRRDEVVTPASRGSAGAKARPRGDDASPSSGNAGRGAEAADPPRPSPLAGRIGQGLRSNTPAPPRAGTGAPFPTPRAGWPRKEHTMDFSRFFIDRPIFAAVLSIVIFAAGLISIPLLPIGEYPEVVPPSVVVRT